MDNSDAMRRCLEELDVPAARSLWRQMAPHLPQPKDDAEALVCLHRARTEARSMPLRLRAYSHRWLTDAGWPSGLPDALRPRAERMYPKVASAVGIAVKMRDPAFAAAAAEIRGAMEYVVLEADADGRLEDARFVRGRMQEARIKARKQLFG